MSALLVAAKQLREIVRQPRALALTLAMPVSFMVIFGLAFGHAASNETFDLVVRDEDGGGLARAYVDGLADLAYDDGKPVFRVTRAADVDEARRALERRDVDALLVVPAGFTQDLTPTRQASATPLQPAQVAPPEGAALRLVGDPSYPSFAVASQALDAYTRAFGERVSGRAPLVAVEEEAVTSRSLDRFDVIAPGLMIFAILNLVPLVASSLAREVESGTIDRLRQSPAGATRILGGVALAQLALAGVSLALMLLAAHLMGFRNQGSYVAAYAIALLAAFAVIGIGLVIASFARTQQEGQNVGILVAVPGSLLSGAFFSIPGVDLVTIGDRTIGLYHVLPTTWAIEALRQVLTFGRTLEDVAFSVGALAVLSVGFLATGVALYRRARLAPA